MPLGGLVAPLAQAIDDADVVDARSRGRADGAVDWICENDLALWIIGVGQPATKVQTEDLGERLETIVHLRDLGRLQADRLAVPEHLLGRALLLQRMAALGPALIEHRRRQIAERNEARLLVDLTQAHVT